MVFFIYTKIIKYNLMLETFQEVAFFDIQHPLPLAWKQAFLLNALLFKVVLVCVDLDPVGNASS